MSAQESETVESGGVGRPSEDELRAAYETELSRITSADMVLQATVSLLNIGARRLGLVGGPDRAADRGGETLASGSHPPSGQRAERDLEQVRDAIDAVRGMMPVIERRAPREARPLRDALSQLQMAYARESGSSAPPAAPVQPAAPGAPAGAPPSGPAADRPPHPPAGRPAAGKPGPGPAESSGRLWVPGR